MKRTLVIGASLKPDRYSNLVIHKLLDKNFEVFAVGNKKGEIKSVNIEVDPIQLLNIDTVTLYINPKIQEGYYDYIVSLKPKRVIFNPGTENPEFYSLLHQHNIQVEVACTLVLLSTNQY